MIDRSCRPSPPRADIADNRRYVARPDAPRASRCRGGEFWPLFCASGQGINKVKTEATPPARGRLDPMCSPWHVFYVPSPRSAVFSER
jgi:hypothetical protein